MSGMEFIEAKDYAHLSKIGSELIIETIKSKPNALICIATGSSPTKTYENFIERVKNENIDTSQLRILKLDEWLGLEPDNLATCEYYIQKNIISPLNISANRYISFKSNTEDPEKECKRISAELDKQGVIDLCILGIGMNGHLGLNEPGDFLSPNIHVVKLDDKTKTHNMLSMSDKKVEYGITIGMSQILTSKKIIFLVSGEKKQESFKQFKKGDISTKIPASFLWLHSNTKCIYDKKIDYDTN